MNAPDWIDGLLVIAPQAYYLRRFAEFDRVGRLHAKWHWAAFFMTFGWLLYRKRYLDCVVYCVAGWSFIKVNIVIILAVAEYVLIGFLADGYAVAYAYFDWSCGLGILVGHGRTLGGCVLLSHGSPRNCRCSRAIPSR